MKGREWYQEDDTAEEYEEWRFSGGGQVVDLGEKERLFELIGDVNQLQVLEFACGTGRFSVELRRRGANVTGVDISRAMLMEGIEKTKKAGLYNEIDFIHGDGLSLPFPDNSFDLVFAMRFFHLAEDPVSYLEEMSRVSKKKIAFDTFSSGSARTLYNRFLPMGSHLYSKNEVKSFIQDAGLEIEKNQSDFVFPFGIYRISPRVVGEGIRKIDDVAVDIMDDRFCSVDYWLAKK